MSDPAARLDYGFLVSRDRVAPENTLPRYQQRRQAELHRSTHGYSRRVHPAKADTTALKELEQSTEVISQTGQDWKPEQKRWLVEWFQLLNGDRS